MSSLTETPSPSQENNILAVAGTHNAAISDPFELLTLKDVAARLKFTRRQCYELTRRRGSSLDHPPLPYFKVNGNIRVLRTDFEAWVKTLAAKGRTQ
jgi:hypothetical protein